jgi:hypothetical protein
MLGMRALLVVVLVGCGGGEPPTVDAGADGGTDAGQARVDFRYRYNADGGCLGWEACELTASVDPNRLESLRGTYSRAVNPDAGWGCVLDNASPTYLVIDCEGECQYGACCLVPPGAVARGCGWVPPL